MSNTEHIIAAWLRSRGLRLVPGDEPWGHGSPHASAIRDLAATVDDMRASAPTRKIDPATLARAVAAAREV